MAGPRIVTFAGSVRTGSYSARLSALAAQMLAELGAAAERLTLADYPMPIYDGDFEAAQGVPESARRLHDRLAAADAVFVVTPEYNAGVPPLLKNAIDWVSRVRDGAGDPFKGPTWAIGSTSPGNLGGYRASIMLRQSLTLGLSCLVLPEQISLGAAASAFDDAGRLKEERQAKLLQTVLTRLIALAATRTGAHG